VAIASHQSNDRSAEDRLLLARYGKGAPEALDALIARHRPELTRLIAGQLNVLLAPRVDASDVTQEVLVEVVRRFPEYAKTQAVPFRVWIRGLARDRILAEHRRHLTTIARSQFNEEKPVGDSEIDPRHSSPSEHQAKLEKFGLVHESLLTLKEDDRNVIYLRVFEALSYEEVATLLEIEPAAARKRIGRALVRLGAQLAERGLSEGDLCP
jgi:RNA polymerase sigma-70 factor (ECF subfamily)